MLGQNLYLLQQSEGRFIHRTRDEGLAARAAQRLFWRAYLSSGTSQLWGALFRKETRLASLAENSRGLHGKAQRFAGARVVSIADIRGSENRSRDFDSQWRPLSLHTADRWERVATARALDVSLPPVELIQIGDRYFVRDGHHRISVARARGEAYVDAVVTVWG